jgi:FkbM family methyltransferase
MLIDLIKLIDTHNLKINGVIHIGGHHGEEHPTYKKSNIDHIIYFEPLKHNFDVLKEITNNEATYIMEALGSTVEEKEMFVEFANKSQSSSLLEPKKHLEQYPWITFDHKIKVKVNLLDNFNLGKEFNFINMDVQGYELEVLKGSKKTLEKIDYIMTEVNRDEVYKECAMVDELDSFLKDYNFERVVTSWDGGTWGDAFYIKK